METDRSLGMAASEPAHIYKELARRLDAIPNGFPATKSGVELRLLAKIFSPEEAALACQLKLVPESVEEIAARLSLDPSSLGSTLKSMAKRGLIRAERGEGGIRYGLMPFVVGIYELQIARMDAEMAALFEEYYREAFGAVTGIQPALHRVIPVERSIQVSTQVLPYERASQMIEEAQAWGVLDCICRKQRNLIGKGCHHPVDVCLVLGKRPGMYDNNPVIKALTKEEAYAVLQRAEEAGLVHTVGNRQKDIDYICNCCTCSCAILRGMAEFGVAAAAARSDFYCEVDEMACVGCELCLERCQFGALAIRDGLCHVDLAKCFGCGLCASVCPEGALHLVRKPEGQTLPPPTNMAEWMLRRAQARQLDLSQIL